MENKNNQNEILFPSPHLFITIIGRRFFGKSILANAILSNLISSHNIHHIIIFSDTAKFNGSYDKFVSKKNIISSEHMDSTIEKLFIHQAKAQKNKRETVIIVVDDVPLNQISKSLAKVASYGRHFNLCCIVSVQYSKGLTSPIIRNNSDYIFIGEVSRPAIQSLYECMTLPFEDFHSFFSWFNNNIALHTFICYNAREHDKNKRMFVHKCEMLPENFRVIRKKKYSIKNDKQIKTK